MTDHPEDLGTLEVFLSAVNIRLFSDNIMTGNATVTTLHPPEFEILTCFFVEE